MMTTIVPAASDVSLTLVPLPNEAVADLFARLAALLDERRVTIVQMTVFGSVEASKAAVDAMNRSFSSIDWPVTWVDGAGCDSHPIAGVQVLAVPGSVERVRLAGRVVASIFEDGMARHCYLGGLRPADGALSRPDQTRQALDLANEALDRAGFSFADTARTWFFLDGMLSWYDDFNQVRTKLYSGIKFRTGSLPASTGVGGRNPAKTALVASLWAARPLNSTKIEEVASPLQCPAPAYGSSFSRAMEMSSPHGRRLTISGTASIAPGGETLWLGDVKKQIDLSMDVIGAILKSRCYSFADITRATAYFKHRADAPAFAEWRAVHGWQAAQPVIAYCDVCRDDLLFELELDAATAKPIQTN